jgi:predicted HAD superfamily Cof-like phosphohydrolase
MTKSAQEMVREFHEVFRHPVPEGLTPVDDETARLRIELIREEFEEFAQGITGNDTTRVDVTITTEVGHGHLTDATEATYTPDLVEIADALADLAYVVYGAAIVHGIDLDAVVAEVHRSNMSKLGEDGQPLRREDGKTLKGPNYFPPDIAKVLGIDPKEDNHARRRRGA